MLYPNYQELLDLRHKAKNLKLHSHRNVVSPMAGSYISPFRGQDLEFEEVREYTHGDDIRNIDWRVTARTGKPHLKVFREERERSILLCVDMSDAMAFGTRGTFKSVQAAKAASLIGWSGLFQQDRIGAVLFGAKELTYIAPKRSRQPLWRLFKVLCNPQKKSRKTSTIEDALRYMVKTATSGTLIFILSDFYDIKKEHAKYLKSLNNKCEVVFLPIADPADYDMPSMGTLEFEDGSGARINIQTGDTKGLKKAWETHQEMLKTLCGRLKIKQILLETNKDIFSTLNRGLQQLSFKR